MIERLPNHLELLRNGSSILLLGPRGTGKSVLCKKMMMALKNQGFQTLIFNFLKSDLYRKYLLHPEMIRQEIEELIPKDNHNKLFVFIDEIQKIPIVLNEVHYLIEENKNRVVFLLTGSSARKLKKANANMLAGRALQQGLYPFTIKELGPNFNLYHALQFGTLPLLYGLSNDFSDIHLAQEQIRLTLTTYVDTYLKEEIKEEALVRNLEAFIRFLEIAAQSNAEMINYVKIGKECSVADTTIKEYFQILMDTLIGFYLSGWHRSVRKQVQKAHRFYFFDNGVLNAINRELRLEMSPTSKRTGKLFESFVIQEFYRLNIYYQQDWKFYYWRTQNNHEVDLVLQRHPNSSPVAIEIKLSHIITSHDLIYLKEFQTEEPSSRLFVLAPVEYASTLDNVKILPWKEGIEKIVNLGDQ